MRPSSAYAPKAPAQRVLYQIVRDDFETFRAAAAARAHAGDGLPRFIEEEFEGFLRCGFLAGGFARFHCVACGFDRLVPFSCKGRAVCPSCGGRRMAERAAHLVDHVFPNDARAAVGIELATPAVRAGLGPYPGPGGHEYLHRIFDVLKVGRVAPPTFLLARCNSSLLDVTAFTIVRLRNDIGVPLP
jgi:hypothetical protein